MVLCGCIGYSSLFFVVVIKASIYGILLGIIFSALKLQYVYCDFSLTEIHEVYQKLPLLCSVYPDLALCWTGTYKSAPMNHAHALVHFVSFTMF